MARPLPVTFVGPGGITYVTDPGADPKTTRRVLRLREWLQYDSNFKARSRRVTLASLAWAGAVLFALHLSGTADAKSISLVGVSVVTLAAALYITDAPETWGFLAPLPTPMLTHPAVAPLEDRDLLLVADETRLTQSEHAYLWKVASRRRHLQYIRECLARSLEMHDPFEVRAGLERAEAGALAALESAEADLARA